MQARLFITALFGFVTVVAGDASAAPRVHFIGHVSSGQTLVDDGPNGRRSLLTLPPWANPEQLLVSPSAKHAFAFVHLEPHKPRTGFVVDLDAGKVSGTFQPGFGGTFFFSPTDSIIQVVGCGTSCATLAFHDTKGKTLGQFLCDGFDATNELARDRRFAACFSAHHLEIIDTTSGKTVLSKETPCVYIGQREGVKFLPGGALRFTCLDHRNRAVESVASVRERIP